MTLKYTPKSEINQAPNFNLRGVDGKYWDLDQAMGVNGLVVMFICNHCPFVKSIQHQLVSDVRQLQSFGVNAVAIMSNDVTDYPEDSYENMQIIAARLQFTFPYLLDESQRVAKAYSAVCTPDFFGYNNDLGLQYRGRLRELKNFVPVKDGESDLLKAMKQIAETGKGPQNQIPSAGCGIKWKYD